MRKSKRSIEQEEGISRHRGFPRRDKTPSRESQVCQWGSCQKGTWTPLRVKHKGAVGRSTRSQSPVTALSATPSRSAERPSKESGNLECRLERFGMPARWAAGTKVRCRSGSFPSRLRLSDRQRMRGDRAENRPRRPSALQSSGAEQHRWNGTPSERMEWRFSR